MTFFHFTTKTNYILAFIITLIASSQDICFSQKITINEGFTGNANWITYTKPSALPVFMKEFGDLTNCKSVVLSISAPGYFEAWFNGNRIGDQVLHPAQTNYDDYVFYSDYTIPTEWFKITNRLDVFIGSGWWNQDSVWGKKGLNYGQPVLLALVKITKNDGSVIEIGTDADWQWVSGPILRSNIHAGDIWDNRVKFEKNTRKNAVLATVFPPKLKLQTIAPEKRLTKFENPKISSPKKDVYVYNFGQNMSGWCQLKIQGKAGQKITLRFAEDVDSVGNLDYRSTGVPATKVVQSDEYICSGEGVETWEPKFSYHGFQYVEVTGLDKKPNPDFLTAYEVRTDIPFVGDFSCSNENINQLHKLNLWTIQSNIHAFPMDCPHRERCGWTGDGHLLASSLMYNFDGHEFYKKWYDDILSSARNNNRELAFGKNFHDRRIVKKIVGIPTMIAPGKRTSGVASPEWGAVMIQVPWQLLRFYNDTTTVRRVYPNMAQWVKYVADTCGYPIVMHGLGDWCPPSGNMECPKPLSSTAIYYNDLVCLSEMAKVLKKETDAISYTKKASEVKQAFIKTFYSQTEFSYGSQTANVLALAYGLFPENHETKIADAIATDIKNKGFITTGIFGLGKIMDVLAENGRADMANYVATKTGYNSFEYMWSHYGATTLREIMPFDDYYDKNKNDEKMRSFSHPMNATTEIFMYQHIGGISAIGNGFQTIRFKPTQTNYLSWANVSFQSVVGKIVSNWKRENKLLTMNIESPTNCEVWVPITSQSKIAINGEIKANSTEKTDLSGKWMIYQLSAGKYSIEEK